jgi:hypothetical protein
MMLTSARQSVTVERGSGLEAWGATMRIGMLTKLAFAAALLATAVFAASDGAWAQSATAIKQIAPAPLQQTATDLSAQRRRARRPPTRLRIYPRYSPDGVYPRYDPGPNAIRDCTATYVQEFRPSGTVIVPRMNCFWRPG